MMVDKINGIFFFGLRTLHHNAQRSTQGSNERCSYPRQRYSSCCKEKKRLYVAAAIAVISMAWKSEGNHATLKQDRCYYDSHPSKSRSPPYFRPIFESGNAADTHQSLGNLSEAFWNSNHHKKCVNRICIRKKDKPDDVEAVFVVEYERMLVILPCPKLFFLLWLVLLRSADLAV